MTDPETFQPYSQYQPGTVQPLQSKAEAVQMLGNMRNRIAELVFDLGDIYKYVEDRCAEDDSLTGREWGKVKGDLNHADKNLDACRDLFIRVADLLNKDN